MDSQKRKANGRLGDATWAAMRDEYVTGNESYAEIAARYGVGKTAVERHALNRGANSGRTWGELRAEFHDEVSRETAHRTTATLAETLASVREKAAAVSMAALERLKGRLDGSEPIEDRDLINIAKLATTVKIELGGDPNAAPVSVRATLDSLSVDELRKLAEGS